MTVENEKEAQKPETGIVKIKGKDYKLIGKRVQEFRKEKPDWCIETEILQQTETTVTIRAKISTSTGYLKATGIAREEKSDDYKSVNHTSWVENCETSAIGRALAVFGYGGTVEFASAEEVSDATIKQEINRVVARQANHIRAAFMYYDSVMAVKGGIVTGELSEAAEAWFTLEDSVKEDLWLSTTHGGIWSTHERDVIKSTEFREAHYGPSP